MGITKEDLRYKNAGTVMCDGGMCYETDRTYKRNCITLRRGGK